MAWTFYNSTGQQLTTTTTGTSTADIATTVTVSDNEAVNENNVLTFVADAAATGGNVGLESDGDLHYNPSTGLLTTTGLTLTGNLTVGGTTTTVNTATFTVEDPIIHLQTASGGGDLGSDTNKDVGLAMEYHNGSAAKEAFLGWDDSAGKLTFIPDASISSEVVSGSVGTIVANLEGNVTGNTSGTSGSTTGNAATVTITDNESINENNLITFIADAGDATGSHGLEMDGTLHYNPSTGLVTATGFAGTLAGNVTGNASGTAATVTGGTQASITTVANVVEVGALDAGSITSGFGTIDIGSSALGSGAITSTGAVTGTSLDCNGNADISGTLTMSGGTLDMSSEDVDNIRSATFIAELDHTSTINNLEAFTLDWGLAQKQMITLSPNSGNAVTITFTDPDGPCNLMLKVKQDGTGSRTITWAADPAVHWPAGTAPTLTTGANSVDLIAFYFDGVIFYGNSSLAFAAP